MATNTTNYDLVKPSESDFYDINVQNQNMDIIDAELTNLHSTDSDLEEEIGTKAPLVSPALTGTPTAPTAAAGNNTTQLATTAFVTTAVANKTSVSGNAGTATKLQTARTISLTGDVTGSGSFDGSGNLAVTATVVDDSHNHIISNVDGLQTALDAKVNASLVGAASGVAQLGSDGKVPAAQLPSYVDDVVEGTLATFPTTGETGKIYVDTASLKTYRWSGSAYVEISSSLALGETASTAYAGDKGKSTADSLAAHLANISNPHSVTASQVGLGNVPNVTTNNQTPTYTIASTLTALVSGEIFTTAMGKIAKAVSSLISHLADSVSHITATERSTWNAKASASHADANGTNGLGSLGVYGHIKLVNNLTTSAYSDGVALSPYQGYVLQQTKQGCAIVSGFSTAKTITISVPVGNSASGNGVVYDNIRMHCNMIAYGTCGFYFAFNSSWALIKNLAYGSDITSYMGISYSTPTVTNGILTFTITITGTTAGDKFLGFDWINPATVITVV